jgi:hypothetical protein
MQPAPGPAFWPGFIPFLHNHYCTAHCPLQAGFYCVISAFLWQSASKYGAMQPGHTRSRPGARSGAPRASSSGRNALLIEYKPTAVASTRESVGLCRLLLVVGGCRGFVRIDRGLLEGGSWGLAPARGTIP